MAKSNSGKKPRRSGSTTPPVPTPASPPPDAAKISRKIKSLLDQPKPKARPTSVAAEATAAIFASPVVQSLAAAARLPEKIETPKLRISPPAKKAPVKIKAAKPATKAKKPAVKLAKPQAATTPHATAGNLPGGCKRLLFITAECTPLAQTGGLGDAVAGLTKALIKRGHDVRIVMPLYQSIDRAKHGIVFSRACCVHFGRGEEIWCGIFEGKLDGVVPIWFIDYGRYFDRPYIYDGEEDSYRFAVLSKAALQVCKDTGFIPHVAHVHDWMSSLAAVFLKTWDRVLSPLSNTASVLTIHNIGYQGKFTSAALPFYGFGHEYLTPDRFEDFGGINLLKAGIQYADVITTVSPTYANEIRGPVGGMGMAMYLNDRSDRVTGILNGVDTEVWNPETDKHLPARYSRGNLAGKAECKRALQERFGLTVDSRIPIFATISRFAPQKGFDLLRGSLPQALRDMVIQVVALGSGDPFTENFFRWLSEANPRGAGCHIGFSTELAHLMEAGSDFFLMPSIYEPCGLNQMYSSLYGTLPIVRATGGLDDTVENYDEAAGKGTGFKFWEISDRALYYTIGWAVSTWYDRPHHIAAMRDQGMTKNFTWEASAQQYESVYAKALSHRVEFQGAPSK